MPRLSLRQWFSFRQMKVWQKCALIAAPFILPIAALLYLVVSQNNDNIVIADAELRGLEYHRPLKKLVQQVGLHRGLAYRILNGDRAAESERTKLASQIDETIREMDQIDARLGAEYKTPETKRWQNIRDQWAALKGQATTGAAEASFRKHTDLISVALDLNTDVWEYSTLALDPVADSYYLQDIMLARSIAGMEDIGQLRDIVTGAVSRGKTGDMLFTSEETIRVNVLLGQIEATSAAIDKETKNAIRARESLRGPIEPAAAEYSTRADTFATKARQLLSGEAKVASPSELFASGSDASSALGKVFDANDPSLVDLISTRANGYQRLNLWAIGGVIVGVVLVALVAYLVTRGITRQVSTLNTVFAQFEGGDHQSRAATTSRDELGDMAGSLNRMLDNTVALIQTTKNEKEEIQRSIMRLLEDVGGVADGDLTKEAEVTADTTGAIADSFNHMIEQLRKIISNVQTASHHVSSATGEIRASTEHLAGGAENQAEQIVHTSAAIEEMAVSIQQVAENATQSTTVAQQALASAKQGDAAVRNTIDGMNRIREQAQETAKRIKRLGETSQEIGQIVQLIDDIADRTGILALNASIQAAAAGDAGRGFAVVAEEVERLAIRATEATKKIGGLVKAIQTETNEAVSAMERNIQEVVSGSKVANQAGQALQEIEGVSVKLADLIQSITLASKQQARGSEALARSMGEISQITQQTAAGTKQTVESVTDLAKLADDLRESVSTFRLPSSYQSHGNGNGNGNGHANGAGKKQLAGMR